MTKWREIPELRDCERYRTPDGQLRKDIDYYEDYLDPFLDSDPVRDWESFERCKRLFQFCEEKVGGFEEGSYILDCGTKDGQFPEWLCEIGHDAVGIEIADSYINYAISRGRPVEFGDVCDLDFESETFDIVFSHHLLGLVSDYFIGMSEMFRVLKPGGYFITLNGIPGNPKKHFNVIESTGVYDVWLTKRELNPHTMIFYDQNPYQQNKEAEEKEIIIFMRKD